MKFSLFLFATAALALGQTTTPPGNSNRPPEAGPPDIATVRAAAANAKNLAKAGNATAAETALAALNTAKANTADWHIETAQRLIQTAEQLAREAQPQNVPALCARALEQLTQAEQRAKTNDERAAAKTLAGFIHEHYLANPTAAIASYEAANQLAPGKNPKASEAAGRLRKLDDTVKSKAANPGR